MESMPFDHMATVYDETRIYDTECFDTALDYIVTRFPPESYRELFEPGIGTGRIAFRFAERGYSVTGVDISVKMLDILQKKIRNNKTRLPVSFREANITALPFPDSSFDIAVVVHLFHLVPEWRRAVDEVLRVLKPGAPLVLFYTGHGTEIPLLRDRYLELCSELGFTYERIGAKNAAELLGHLEEHGRYTENVGDRWKWTQRMRLDKTLDYMKNRAYSHTTLTPEKIHVEAINMLESEIKEQYGSLSGEVDVPNQLYFVLSLSSS